MESRKEYFNYREMFRTGAFCMAFEPTFACIVGGSDEAIVLNQLQYWLTENVKARRNFHDGRHWAYNSYKNWAATSFPMWSEFKVRRVFNKLERSGLLISGNYNKLKSDNTKWYTIDYDKLNELAEKFYAKHEELRPVVSTEEVVADREDVKAAVADKPNPIKKFTNELKERLGINRSMKLERTSDETSCRADMDRPLGEFDRPIPENNLHNTLHNNTTIPNTYYIIDSSQTSWEGAQDAHGNSESDLVHNRKERKPSRYIPKEYTYEQLRDHIDKPIRDKVEEYNSDIFASIYTGIDFSNVVDTEPLINDIKDIVIDFCQQYEKNTGKLHKVLSDQGYSNIVDAYLNSPECLKDCDEVLTHHILIEDYFTTTFNILGNFKHSVVKSLSHFMSPKIREVLYARAC